MTKLNDLIEKILNRRSQVRYDRSVLVAVSGIDGSGKGYITEKIVSETQSRGVRAIAINIDPWLTLPEQRFNSENPAEHFYHHAFPFDRLFEQLIYPLQKNRSIYLKTTLTGQFGIPFAQIYDN